MIRLFVNEVNKNKDKIDDFINNNYKVREGIYLKIDIDKPFDKDDFKDYLIVQPKNNEFISAICEPEIDINSLSEYFIDRDFKSKILNEDANKCIDIPAKKCLSSIYLTLALNKGKIKEMQTTTLYEHLNSKVTQYYLNVGDKIKSKLQLNKLKYMDDKLERHLNYADSSTRKDRINIIDEYIKNNLESIIDFTSSKDIRTSSIIKMFFYSGNKVIDDSVETYIKEEELYLSTCIFNNATTEIINGELKGAIPYGYNNNDDKPFIKPRFLNIDYVDLHTLEEARNTKRAFDFMKVVNDRRSSRTFGINNVTSTEQFNTNLDELIEIDNKNMILRLQYEKKYIEEYDLRANISNKRKTIGSRIIKCNNYIYDKYDFKLSRQGTKETTNTFTIKELMAFIMFIWSDSLNKYSSYSAYGTNKNMGLENKSKILFSKYKYVVDSILNSITLTEKDISKLDSIIYEYFKAYIDSYNSNVKGFRNGVITILNIRLNVLNTLREEVEDIMSLNSIDDKLNSIKANKERLAIDNDKEFYFILGQIAYYLESQSKADVKMEVFKFYTTKKNIQSLKRYLIQNMEKYSYAIDLRNNLYKNISAALMEYIPTSSITDNLQDFYTGAFADNIFYKKGIREVGGEN